MSRTIPWRSKPTALITQMIPVANEYKLYLVHETGPTSFVFKDDNDNKFKVSIGSIVTCSCGIVQNDHCIHTLFALLKRFKVPQNNPILWQASYLDSELEGFVQFKYEAIKKEEKKKHDYKKVNQNPNFNIEDPDDFPLLQDDAMCPICYDEMKGECYSTCKTCKKSLHTRCFKIWTRHKEDNKLPVTCPMCRSQFQNPMVIIYKDLEKWQARFLTHKGTLCKGCGMKNIKGNIYKCLLCSGFDLCKMCFEGNQHIEHERFVVKQSTVENWKWAAIRVKKTKKQLFQPNKQINIKQLNSIEDEELIVDLFPTLKEFSSNVQQTSALGIVGNEILPKQMCFKCKTVGNEMMKRLNCGHSLHQQCLKFMIKNKEYLCEVDNQIYCPGYFQAIGVKVVKTKKKPVECNVLKNEEEMNRIKDSINNLEINGFVPKIKVPEKRNQSVGGNMNKSKDRNFRIMKKTQIDKRNEEQTMFGATNLGMIMITGLGQHSQNPVSQIRQQIPNFPPKSRSNINSGNFR